MAAMAMRVLTVLVLGVMVVASLYLYDFLTTSGRLAVAQVELDGISRIDDGEVRRLLSDLEGQNILLAPLDQYRERIEAYPRVESARFSRILPDRIRCNITEREPTALVFTDRFVEIDREGMVMAEDEFTPLLDLPIITGASNQNVRAGKVCQARGVRNALEVLRVVRELGGDFASRISEINVSGDNVVVRSLENDCVLVLGDSDYELRLRKYFLLEDTIDRDRAEKRVVDLRFEDQVVLRAGN
jgi:cell division septal protein FtsQ